ncbi:MAG: alpha/beta hydrolase [Cyanobacteria bacterium P01_F01_bin.86]
MNMPEPKPETYYVRLSDERQVAYCEYGDRQGKPVFYCHGTPGSRYEPALGDSAGQAYGYRIIALDRPGIGQSDYVKGRRLLDWPQDVKEVARQLGISRFGVIGASGGGAYALACSYALSEQLEFAAVMGSWGPVTAASKLWDAMAPLDRFFAQLSQRAPWAFYVPFSLLGYAAKRLSPQGFMKLLESSMSPADKQCVADTTMAQFYADDVAEAFRQGVRGPADDAILLYGDWGFGVESIPVKVHLFHGEEDWFAPYSYALYFNEKIPQTKLHSYPGKGHLFIVALFADVFQQLAP